MKQIVLSLQVRNIVNSTPQHCIEIIKHKESIIDLLYFYNLENYVLSYHFVPIAYIVKMQFIIL